MESPPSETSATSKALRPCLLLPSKFSNSTTRFITQGAEAIIYQTTFLRPSFPCALKFRPSKPYRHPTLDARLTKHRILSEARVLNRCRKEGVSVPAVYALDEKDGWLMIEWINGEVIRKVLNEWLKDQNQLELKELKKNIALKQLLREIGLVIGKLHSVGVVHGDLTTSNLMLRSEKTEDPYLQDNQFGDNSKIILIDFGLASQSSQDEDRAVDLYVLERAFGSTHPQAETLFSHVLDAYRESFKEAKTVLKRLEEVRMRGRKRSMLG